MNILFVQDSSPCIRNIKYAEALSALGHKIYLLYKHKDPDTNYGFGNGFYASLIKYKYRYQAIKFVVKTIREQKIDLIHYHNQPDILCAKMIRNALPVPLIFDCHDFLSFKHKLSGREKQAERICNERSSGVVYPAASYLEAARQYYKFTDMQLVFGNYYPSDNLLDPNHFREKLSTNDGKIHLIYQGRLAEKKSDHRYIVEQLKHFDPDKYTIHIYPSNNKEFADYRRLPSCIVHNKLPYAELIKEISAYDYGMVMFNDSVVAKLPAIKYAFGNKTFDYLCAGLPILVQDSLDEIRQFVQKHQVGILISQLTDNNLQKDYMGLVNNVIKIREGYSMEAQLGNLLAFYQQVLDNFNGK